MKSFFSKANGFIGIMFLLVIGWLPVQAQVNVMSQFINPCGLDGSNEFIIFQTSSSLSIHNIGMGSYDPAGGNINYNYWWYGDGVPSCPYSTFSSYALESCGANNPSGGAAIETFGLLYPSISADATIINNVISSLNTVAGCNVFLPVPSTDIIPPNSNVIFFLAAGSCGLDNVSTNLDFSNHCSSGTPKTQYYVVVGKGDGGGGACGAANSGYFSNSSARVSALWIYKGSGSNTSSANYYTSSQSYTPGSITSGSAGVVVPGTAGVGTWLGNAGCVPSAVALGVLPDNNIELSGSILTGFIRLNWQVHGITDIAMCELERSEDARSFTQVFQEDGSAYSAYIPHQFDDRKSNTAKIYYRVKVIMNDGRFYYSNIVKFKLYSFQSDDLLLLSNPVISTLNFKLAIKQPGLFNFTIFNTAGSKVYSSAMHLNRGEQVINLPVSHFASGVYYLSASNNEDSFTKTFIKK